MALLEQTHRQDPAVTGAAVAKVDAVGKEAEVHQDQKAQKIRVARPVKANGMLLSTRSRRSVADIEGLRSRHGNPRASCRRGRARRP